jgi:hypothetical protein
MRRSSESNSQRVGIEFSTRFVRVVNAEAGPKGARILGFGSAPMPPDAIKDWVVADIPALAGAIRQALRSAGIIEAKAYVTVPDAFTPLFSLPLPNAENPELSILVREELDRRGALYEDGSLTTFLQPQMGQAVVESDSVPTAAFVASSVSLAGFSQALEEAGLRSAVVEPQQIALLRGALDVSQSRAITYLLVGDHFTDFAILADESVRAYSRVEVGLGQLVGDTISVLPEPDAGWQILVDQVRTLQSTANHESGDQFKCCVVAAPEHATEIASRLAAASGATVEVPRYPQIPGTSSSSNQIACAGFSFAAYGLLLGDASPATVVPQAEFVRAEPGRVVAERRATMVPYAFAAAFMLIVGAAASLYIRGEANAMRQEAVRLRSQASQSRAQLEAVQKQKATQALQYQKLQSRGVPLAALIEGVANSMPPTVGLESVTIGPDLKVRISGEAKTEEAFAQAVKLLQDSAPLRNVQVAKLKRSNNAKPLVRFEVLAVGLRLEGTGRRPDSKVVSAR